MAAGCYRFAAPYATVTVEQAPDSAWTRLGRLESFSFRLSYHTDSPLAFSAAFTGMREAPDREIWQGEWRRGRGVSRVEFRAAGDVQYEKSGTGWQRAIRGAETKILEQARQVVEGRRMEWAGTARGIHRYRFVPWLPILDPGRQRSFSGTLEIDGRTGLPLRMRCTEDSARAAWDLRLSRFGRAGRVVLPFVAAQAFVLTPEKRVSRNELGQSLASLRARLGGLERLYRLERRCGRLMLMLEQTADPGVLELLFAPGRLEVYSARRATASDADGVLVGRDAAVRVVLTRLILANQGSGARFDVETEIGPLPEPRLRFTPFDGTSLALGEDEFPVLVLDGGLTDWTGSADGASLTFLAPKTPESALLYAAIARNPPMAARLRHRVTK